MIIDGREIGPSQPPYIIAEVSCNHAGDLAIAKELITAAKEAGADAVKFQAYTPDTITLDCDNQDFIIKDGPWKGRTLYSLYKDTYTPFEWFPELFQHAREVGITIFASVFDKSSVDMLERLGCPAYKIASMEIVDLPLIKRAAKTLKPIIISCGMSSVDERADAMDAVDSGVGLSERELILLQCMSNYPTKVGDYPIDSNGYGWNKQYDGISDHTLGWEIPVAATALGTAIIEKHFKLQHGPQTEDSAFSLGHEDFAKMVKAVCNIWHAMQTQKDSAVDDSSRQLRRSLYVTQDMKTGECFTEDNVRSIRPSYGLPPKELPNVLGKCASCDIKRGTALSWALVV